ncbi:hypothetical protein ACIQF6_00055 [Kitasatospora sp. NPDC092948]|uniref:hypothetical protein n=1 Tax=Kitasatospora sp. NPDC092948 TaxID=3364088 RepID=UPI00380DB061
MDPDNPDVTRRLGPSKSVAQGDLTELKQAGMIDNIKKQRVLPPPKPCEEQSGRTSAAEEGTPAMPDRMPEEVDPRFAAVDAALDRDDPDVGTEVIALVLASDDFEAVAARVERALGAARFEVRQLACVAAGDLARISGRLTPGIFAALRAEGLGGVADTAIRDALTFIPFRRLPRWWRWTSARLSVRDWLEGQWLRAVDAVETARDAARRARSGRSRRSDRR